MIIILIPARFGSAHESWAAAAGNPERLAEFLICIFLSLSLYLSLSISLSLYIYIYDSTV